MNTYINNLTYSQINTLIDAKRSEIETLSEQLSAKQLELNCFELLKKKIAEIHPDTIWQEFLEFIDQVAPELSLILKRADLISLLPGKLVLRCRDIDSEILFYQKATVEKYLNQHFEIAFAVSIINDNGSN